MTGTVVPMAIAPTNPNAAAVLAKVRIVPPFSSFDGAKPCFDNAKPWLPVAEKWNLKTRRFEVPNAERALFQSPISSVADAHSFLLF
jgi:hypothetical protein